MACWLESEQRLIFGLDGVWLAQPISDILAIVITLICLLREFKNLKQKELDWSKIND